MKRGWCTVAQKSPAPTHCLSIKAAAVPSPNHPQRTELEELNFPVERDGLQADTVYSLRLPKLIKK